MKMNRRHSLTYSHPRIVSWRTVAKVLYRHSISCGAHLIIGEGAKHSAAGWEQRRGHVVHSNATCTGKLKKRIIMPRTLSNLALKSLFGVIAGVTIFTHQAISAPIASSKGVLVDPLNNSQVVQVRAARSGYRGGSVHRGAAVHRRATVYRGGDGGSTGGSCSWRPVLWRFLRSLLSKLRRRQLLSWRSLSWRRGRQGRSRCKRWHCCPRRISRSPCWSPSGRRTPSLMHGYRLTYD